MIGCLTRLQPAARGWILTRAAAEAWPLNKLRHDEVD